jgi:hypothetical protein
MIRSRFVPFCLGLVLSWSSVVFPAGAQPAPSAIAAARELIEIKGATTMFNVLIPGIVETVKNSFLPTHPQLAKELNEVAAQLRNEFAPRRGDILTELATMYAQRFSEQEMKEAIAFYKTATGKKFATEEPVVVDLALSRINDRAEKISAEVMNRFRAEMKKKGHDL